MTRPHPTTCLTVEFIALDVLQMFHCHLEDISLLQLGLLLREEQPWSQTPATFLTGDQIKEKTILTSSLNAPITVSFSWSKQLLILSRRFLSIRGFLSCNGDKIKRWGWGWWLETGWWGTAVSSRHIPSSPPWHWDVSPRCAPQKKQSCLGGMWACLGACSPRKCRRASRGPGPGAALLFIRRD